MSEDDEHLGRVHDVRVRMLQRRGSEGEQMRVIGLVIGGRGIRERLGLDVGRGGKPIADRDLIEWERVLKVRREGPPGGPPRLGEPGDQDRSAAR